MRRLARKNKFENIIAKLGNDVTAFAKSRHYNASDFKQIIHIIDTDGAYIPDEKIVEETKESWDYIERNMNSVNRYSNFSICIQQELSVK